MYIAHADGPHLISRFTWYRVPSRETRGPVWIEFVVVGYPGTIGGSRVT
jgi:hypothetical protein